MTDPPDLWLLRRQIEAHPGTIAQARWNAWSSVHALLLGNEAELMSLVERIESNEDGLGLVLMDKVGPGEALFREIIRLLHNYLAAVVTLVDHTRNHMLQYEATPVGTQYQGRLQKVRGRGITSFMTKFRNFVLHYDVPPIGATIEYRPDAPGLDISLYLDRDASLQYKDWPKAAREFLREQPEQVSVRALIEEYSSLIEGLYRWLYDQFPVLHGADIDAVNELIMQMPAWRNSDGSPGGRSPQPQG